MNRHEQWLAVLGLTVAILVHGGLPATASTSGAGPASPTFNVQDPAGVRALIVKYDEGITPTLADGTPRGASRVTGRARHWLRPGRHLGDNTWTVLLTKPTRLVTAQRIARQMMRDPGVIVAEPDQRVTIAR